MNRTLCVISILLTLLAVPVSAQTVAPQPYLTILDSNGDPVSGCHIHTFAAGTTTAATTYSDSALLVANANPVVCDSAGRAVIYLVSGSSYKFTIETAAGVVIRTVDNVQAIPSASSTVDVLGTAGEALLADDIVYLSDGSGALTAGKWYKADADNTYSSTLPLIGVATANIALNGAGAIRLEGYLPSTGLGGAVGVRQYISATAGDLTATAPTNARVVGYTLSAGFVVAPSSSSPTPMDNLTGAPTAVTHAAGNFTSEAPQTWTVASGDQAVFTYLVTGKVMTVWLNILTSTIDRGGGGGHANLYVTIPGGHTAARTVAAPAQVFDNGTEKTGLIVATAASTKLTVNILPNAAWTASADNAGVRAVFSFEIQ